MTVKEHFPRLEIKEQASFDLEDLRYTHWTMERLLEDIQKNYLNKGKVREAISKHCGLKYCIAGLCEELEL